MYSGITLRNQSGNLVGVHQRIDRVARRHLAAHLDETEFFPSIRDILHFEGKNGPDGIKSKSPSQDEPWHYIAPTAVLDDPLVRMISDHIHNLAVALRSCDEVRASFEAAWVAHAVVDGLTPAHHFPLAETIEELWGKEHTSRTSIKEKLVITGVNRRDTATRNWRYWGAKGVFSAHILFEIGVAAAIATSRFRAIGLTDDDVARVARQGYEQYFLDAVREVDEMGTFQQYVRSGWSLRLAHISRTQLVPLIAKNVSLAWYAAIEQSKRPALSTEESTL